MEINVTSWEMEKAIMDGVIEIPYSKRQGAWVAEIVGTHPVYKLDRKFVDAEEDNGAVKTWKIEEGKIYCICPSTKTKEQYFVKLDNDELNELTKADVEELINKGGAEMLVGISQKNEFGEWKFQVEKFPNLESAELWLDKEQYDFRDRAIFDDESKALKYLVDYISHDKAKEALKMASINTLKNGELKTEFSDYYIWKMMR